MKKIKHICGNCKLFDCKNNLCAVVILHEGQRVHLPVDAKDPCFYEQEYFDPTAKAMEDFNEIKEVQFWVENAKGEKTDGNGAVKVRYPEGFLPKDLYHSSILTDEERKEVADYRKAIERGLKPKRKKKR
jgi:hypothetical protein